MDSTFSPGQLAVLSSMIREAVASATVATSPSPASASASATAAAAAAAAPATVRQGEAGSRGTPTAKIPGSFGVYAPVDASATCSTTRITEQARVGSAEHPTAALPRPHVPFNAQPDQSFDELRLEELAERDDDDASSHSARSDSSSSPSPSSLHVVPAPARLLRSSPQALAASDYEPHRGFIQRETDARSNVLWQLRRLQRATSIVDAQLCAELQAVQKPAFRSPANVNRVDTDGHRLKNLVAPADKDHVVKTLSPLHNLLKPAATIMDIVYLAALSEARMNDAEAAETPEAELLETNDDLRSFAVVREALLCALLHIDVQYFELHSNYLATRKILPSALQLEHHRLLQTSSAADGVMERRLQSLARDAYHRQAAIELNKTIPVAMRPVTHAANSPAAKQPDEKQKPPAVPKGKGAQKFEKKAKKIEEKEKTEKKPAADGGGNGP